MLVITGVGFTAMVTESIALHPKALVPVTKYFVVSAGVATGLAIDAFESPAVGVHE